MIRVFSGGLVRQRRLVGAGLWPHWCRLVAVGRVFGVLWCRRVIGGDAIDFSFLWVTAMVILAWDLTWVWQLGTRSWLYSFDLIMLALTRGWMGIWWMGGWDQISSMLWPIVWIGLVLNWDGLGCWFVTVLKGFGRWFGGWACGQWNEGANLGFMWRFHDWQWRWSSG